MDHAEDWGGRSGTAPGRIVVGPVGQPRRDCAFVAIETTPEMAAECGAPEPGEPHPVDMLEDFLQA